MSYKIVLYTTKSCPYCLRAKALLEAKGLKYQLIDATGNEELRQEIMQKSGGKKTVPQIFINDKNIGGFDDLSALNSSGELDKILQA